MPPKRDPSQLDEIDRQILRFLIAYYNEHGRSPTVREIVAHVPDISSTSVAKYHLEHLKEAGRIDYPRGIARGIEVQDLPRLKAVPKVGTIVAGQPITTAGVTLEDAEEWVTVPVSWLPHPKRPLFALEVRGDSMVDASIHHGDIVVLEPVTPDEVHNGDMVAAWIKSEGETTLKCFYREGEQVRLQPANAAYTPIYVPAEDVEIQGRVVAVLRPVRGCGVGPTAGPA